MNTMFGRASVAFRTSLDPQRAVAHTTIAARTASMVVRGRDARGAALPPIGDETGFLQRLEVIRQPGLGRVQ